jgi:hypothetical protein
MRPDPNSTDLDLMDLSITIRDDDMPPSLMDTIPELNNIKSQDLLTGLLSLQHVSNQIGRATQGSEKSKLFKINHRIQKAFDINKKPTLGVQPGVDETKDKHGVVNTKAQLGGMRILQSMAQRGGGAATIAPAPEPMPSPLPTSEPKDSPSSGQAG